MAPYIPKVEFGVKNSAFISEKLLFKLHDCPVDKVVKLSDNNNVNVILMYSFVALYLWLSDKKCVLFYY